MKKAVLLPVTPQRARLILEGKITLDARRSFPKLQPPFVVYLYETKERYKTYHVRRKGCFETPNDAVLHDVSKHYEIMEVPAFGKGRVVGKVICDFFVPDGDYKKYREQQNFYIKDSTYLDYKEIDDILKGKPFCGWHFTEPRKFSFPISISDLDVSKPPITFCYVEEIQDV